MTEWHDVCEECGAVEQGYTDGLCDECYDDEHGPPMCSLCPAPVKRGELRLCPSCYITMQAHARLERNAREYAEDCRNDPFLDRRMR